MATFRFLQTDFWRDDYFLEISPEDKYFYIYLLTNGMCTQCGIYQLIPKFAALELGYSVDTVKALIDRFVGYGKILYNEEKCEVMLLNWYRYNMNINNRNSRICINTCLKKVKTEAFVNILYNSCIEFFEDNRAEVEAMFKGVKVDLKSREVIYPNFNRGQAEDANYVSDFEGVTEGENYEESYSDNDFKNEEIAADCEEKGVTFGEVINTFNQNFHMVTPIEREKLLDWCEVLSPAVVVRAIEISVESNVRNMKYLNAILVNWDDNGVKDLDSLEAKLREDSERKKGSKNNKQGCNSEESSASDLGNAGNIIGSGSNGTNRDWECQAHNKIFDIDDKYEDEDVF